MTEKTLLQLCQEAENLGIRTHDNATQGKAELKAAIEEHPVTRTAQTIQILQEAVQARKGGC